MRITFYLLGLHNSWTNSTMKILPIRSPKGILQLYTLSKFHMTMSLRSIRTKVFFTWKTENSSVLVGFRVEKPVYFFILIIKFWSGSNFASIQILFHSPNLYFRFPQMLSLEILESHPKFGFCSFFSSESRSTMTFSYSFFPS